MDPLIVPVVKQALWVTLNGMLGLFIFMGVFYALVQGMMRLFPAKPEPPKES